MQSNNLDETTAREKLYHDRDMKFAALLDELNHTKGIQDTQKEELLRSINEIYDLVLQVDMNQDLENLRKDRRMRSFYKKVFSIFEAKHLRIIFLSFVVGVILTLVPSLIHISSLSKDNIPAFQFLPNTIGYHKPSYVQIIDTSEKLELVKKSAIVDKDSISLGGAVKLGKRGLVAIPGEEMRAPGYHTKFLGPMPQRAIEVLGYHFIPDTLLTIDPLTIQIIHTPTEVKTLEKSNLSPKEFLSIGGGVICPQNAKCFITAKTTLDNEYEKLIPISEFVGQK